MRIVWVLAAIILSGCVLHSETRYFGDADAVLILGHHPHSFAAYSAKDGVWVPMDARTVRAVPVGQHYTIADPNRVDVYVFIPLDANRYVVQAFSTGNPAFTTGNPGADYAIASWDGTTEHDHSRGLLEIR